MPRLLPDLATVPAPYRGGTRLYCPMVDVGETERTSIMHMCGWPSRADTRGGRKAIRRHLRRDHIAPFIAETGAVMRYLASGRWGSAGHVRAEVEVSKAR